MHNYFQQVKSYIEKNYPEHNWQITGSNYPPSAQAELISKITSTLWFVGIVVLMGGEQILKLVGLNQPELLDFVSKNKVGIFFGLFLLNSLGASQLTTGAFEVYFDADLIYSKLQTGRLPNPTDIAGMLTPKLN